MKNSILFLSFFISIFTFFKSAYAQNYTIKEWRYGTDNTLIQGGSFKNGKNIIYFVNGGTFYLREINPLSGKPLKILDSIYTSKDNNVIPYFKDTDLCHVSMREYFILGSNIPSLYLYRKNVSKGTADSIFFGELDERGYTLKRFNDTDVVQIKYYNSKIAKFQLATYIIVENTVLRLFLETENVSSYTKSDFYFGNFQLILVKLQGNNKLKFYNYSLQNNKLDTVNYNFANIYHVNLTMVNQNFGLVCLYQNAKDSLYLFDLGKKGISFTPKANIAVEKDYLFIGQSNNKDYFVTGNNSGKHNRIHYIDSNFKIVIRAELNTTIDGEYDLMHYSFYENLDTMYFMGVYDIFPEYAYFAKVYPSKTGISLKEATSDIITIYPNPCHSFINLNVANPPREITIADVFGKQIVMPITENGYDVTRLAKGFYILRYHANDTVVVGKFYKE